MPLDERTYITVHDGMPEHPKVEGLSDAAFRLMVETWCWCSRNRTDGVVRAASWVKRGTPRTRAELLAEGLVEATDDGVKVHDYTKHQRTAAEIDELSARRKLAGSKGGRAAASARASAQASATPSAQAKSKPASSKAQAESVTETEPLTTSVVETRERDPSTTQRGTRLPPDWRPSPTDIDWARAESIPDALCRAETAKFCDYWPAQPGAKGRKADWPATWRNWIRKAVEHQAQHRPATATDKVVGIGNAAQQAKDMLRARQAQQPPLELPSGA